MFFPTIIIKKDNPIHINYEKKNKWIWHPKHSYRKVLALLLIEVINKQYTYKNIIEMIEVIWRFRSLQKFYWFYLLFNILLGIDKVSV